MERPRERSVVMTVVAAAASMAVFGVGMARATDQGVTGKKLLMKSGKVVLLSKDPIISVTASDPVGGSDSSVTFNNGSGAVPWSLPKTSWSTNGSTTLFKYKNASAPSGPSPVKITKVASGLLKMVAKGVPFAVPNGAATVDIVLSLDGGTNTYCMTFSGTGDGSKFLVKDAAAGTCAGGGAVCGNNVKEGSEQCDGTDDTACPGNCTASCTCPAAQTCGNNVREGTEQCDGTDDTACPGNCTASCTCPPVLCPATGGDTTACSAYHNTLPCKNCVDANSPPGDFVCLVASTASCAVPSDNDVCSAEVNAIGCGSECCPVCGNNVREATEACDGSDDAACPGLCRANCVCGAAVCGNNVIEGFEQCDGTDNTLCPGRCVGCMCAPNICGNNVREGTETCDGTDDTACPGRCRGDCNCPPVTCSNNVREIGEECDGTDNLSCTIHECLSDCTCGPQICGDSHREGTEACDFNDDLACFGLCQPDCKCPTGLCPADDSSVCSTLSFPNCATCCEFDGSCFVACNGVDCSSPGPQLSACASAIRVSCPLECCP